jgi:DNA modification methylase
MYQIGDLFEARLGEQVFDLAEFDPYYGVALRDSITNDGMNVGALNALSYEDISDEDFEDYISKIIQLGHKTIRSDGWIILWFPITKVEMIIQLVQDFNEEQKIRRQSTLIYNIGFWNKPSGRTNAPKYNLAMNIEPFLYMRKSGEATIKTQGRTATYSYTPPASSKRTHPTERPVEMYKELFKTFASPGANVLIGFAGSGAALIAAIKLDMKPLGFDKMEMYKPGYILKLNELNQ